ncbi:amidohydrolase family protein [Aeromicrobium piscarium]|uniref:Amidohydrolase n=1 Tax=Aeromicrobium piscarium TaxID=2590901 RepID=A0A554SCX9_9ACTN|nr:amidohydrolase [Aeromicrobium piscarium]TSD64200.1 amidohydrolase [Aeromicrobium piscarium]
MTDQLLTHATILTFDEQSRVIEDGAIAFDDETGLIVDVGPTSKVIARRPGATVRECRGAVIMPGMINTHTHLFQTLLKGLGDDMVLSEWFASMTGPSASELTWDDCYLAALHGCAEALTTGTTTLLDFMYVHPRRGLSDAVIAAMEETGIRGIFARGYVTAGDDVGMPPALIQPLDTVLHDAHRLIDQHNRPGSLVEIALAPCMSWSVDEDTLRETARLADDTGALITMHLAESPFDITESLRRFGCRDTELLRRTDVLGPRLLAVHCVQCDHDDLGQLAHAGAAVSHNPCSNLYLGSGVAPVSDMLTAGLRVGLATDGPASSNNLSMFHALKFAALVPKGVHRDPQIITAGQVLRMATRGGAEALGMADRIGSLEPGKAADIVLLDPSTLSITPMHDPVSSLVYSHRGDEVRDVWVAGRQVVSDGTPFLVDAGKIRESSSRAALALAERAGTAR